MLYALGSDGDLVCLETSSGETRWHKNLRSDFAGQPGTWAYAESPLVDGDVLVCTPGGAEATVVVLNKQTGDVIWKCVSPEADQAAYSSAIAAQIDGKKQYIQFLQKGVVGIDPADGQILWRYSKTAKGSPANIPTPLVAGDYIYTATGMAGSGLVNVKKTEGAYDAEQVYYTSKLPNSIGGTVKLAIISTARIVRHCSALNLSRAIPNGRTAALRRRQFCSLMAVYTCMVKTETLRWSKPRPMLIGKRENSPRPISPTEVLRKLGPTP